MSSVYTNELSPNQAQPLLPPAIQVEDNEPIPGEFKVWQKPCPDNPVSNDAVVVWRISQPENIVSKACINRFGRESWEEINDGRQPQHGDEIKLKLSWSLRPRLSLPFTFRVDATETQQIVLGSVAYAGSKGTLRRADGSVYVVKLAKDARKANKQNSAQAEVRKVEREKDKLIEAENRLRSRQKGQRGSDSSDISIGSMGSLGTTSGDSMVNK